MAEVMDKWSAIQRRISQIPADASWDNLAARGVACDEILTILLELPDSEGERALDILRTVTAACMVDLGMMLGTEGMVDLVAILRLQLERPAIVPHQELVERYEDMSRRGRLRVYQQEDGDMCLAIIPDPDEPERGYLGLEFTTCGMGGGQSPHTLAALRALSVAMDQDNRERPQSRSESAPAPTEPGALPAGSHVCGWPGCTAWVGAHSWGCRPHWSQLPMHLQLAIRLIARSGGTEGMQARVIAPAVQDWIEQEGRSDG